MGCFQDAQKSNFTAKCLNTFVAHCSNINCVKSWYNRIDSLGSIVHSKRERHRTRELNSDRKASKEFLKRKQC